MKHAIVVVDSDRKQSRELCTMLEEGDYLVAPIHSLKNLKNHIKQNDCQAVIVDLDSMPVDNRMIRELTKLNPRIHFFCMSKKRFHPELEEAIYNHFFACLYKPIDPDELFYLLKSIHENGIGS